MTLLNIKALREFGKEGKNVLVVGATGTLSGEICRQLAEGGRPVRALVRKTSNPGAVERLEGAAA